MGLQSIEVDEGVYEVPLSLLLEIVGNPFDEDPVWTGCSKFSIEDVLAAMEEDLSGVAEEPYDSLHEFCSDMEMDTTSYHVARVAYLVKHGCNGYRLPQLEYSGQMRGPGLDDGNHRLAAAVVRNDTTFKIEIGGFLDMIEDDFKVDLSANG